MEPTSLAGFVPQMPAFFPPQPQPQPAPSSQGQVQAQSGSASPSAPLAQAPDSRQASPPDTRPDTGLIAAGSSAPPQPPGSKPAAALSDLDRTTCVYMMNVLSKYKEAEPFRQPVDWKLLGIPDYPQVIKNPMDLKTCRDKLRKGQYRTMDEWKADVQLIWANCRKYNGDLHPFTRAAEKLQQHFERRMDEARTAAARELAAITSGAASKGPARAKSRDLMTLSLMCGSDLDEEDDRLNAPPRTQAVKVQQRSPEPPAQRLPMKRASSGANLQDTAAIGLQAAGSMGSFGAAAAAGKAPPPKRRASGTGAGVASGLSIPGADMDALEQLTNTPAARQLGIGEPDDLAFLAVWKRVIARKQAALSEVETLRAAAKQQRRQLTAADERVGELVGLLEKERAARQAAEQLLQELQQEFGQLQKQHKHQGQVLDHQKVLLEQQQVVLRQVLQRQQQQQQQQGQGPTASATSAPAPPPAPAPAARASVQAAPTAASAPSPAPPPAAGPMPAATPMPAAPELAIPEDAAGQVQQVQPQQQPLPQRELSPAPQQQQQSLVMGVADAWPPSLLRDSMSPELECLE